MTNSGTSLDPALSLPWWEQWQGRIEWELASFERWGLEVHIVEDPRAGGARLVLESQAPLQDGTTTRIRVVFPDSYPHRPFHVYAPDLDLPRHQSPGGNLCVFPRGDTYWRPHNAAADSVAADVPRLVALVAEGGDTLIQNEDPQGEPFSAYYETTVQGGIVLNDPPFAIDPSPGDHGQFDVAFRHNQADWMAANLKNAAPDATIWTGQGLMVALRTTTGSDLIGAPKPELRGRYGDQTMTGRWAYLDQPPLVGEPDEFWTACATARPELARWVQGTTGAQLVGACFPEEIQQGIYGLGWAFVYRQVTEERTKGKGARGGKSGNPSKSAIARSETNWQFV